MNIYATFQSPVQCAAVLDDRRIPESIRWISWILSSGMGKKRVHPTLRSHKLVDWINEDHWHFCWGIQYMVALERRGMQRGQMSKESRHLGAYGRWLHDLTGIVAIGADLPDIEFCNISGYDERRLSGGVMEGYKRCLLNKWRKDMRAPEWNGVILDEAAQLKMLGLKA